MRHVSWAMDWGTAEPASHLLFAEVYTVVSGGRRGEAGEVNAGLLLTAFWK